MDDKPKPPKAIEVAIDANGAITVDGVAVDEVELAERLRAITGGDESADL